MIDVKARLGAVLAEARRSPVKAGAIQSAGMLKEVLDGKKGCVVTRYGHVEAYLIPAHIFKEML